MNLIFLEVERRIIVGTIVVGAILIVIVALIIRSMIRDKKAGKSIHCGVECKNCGGYCHQIKHTDGERQDS